MYLQEFFEIAIIHLFAVMSPGPDFAVVTRYSLNYGRETGRWVALGIGTGILLHVTYSLVGVSLLIHQYQWLYATLLVLGIGYFLWLGIPSLLAKPRAEMKLKGSVDSSIPVAKAFWVGFMTNGLNVKATLFFLMLFSSVIAPETPFALKAGYGVYLAVATGTWFVLLATFVTWPRFYARFWHMSHWIDRVMGVILIVFAIHLARLWWELVS